MSKFFRRVVLILFVVLLGSTSFGLSYFYFANEQSQESKIDSNIKIDDIKENYDFGQNTSDKEGKTYTIYFFPSASYLYLYSQYLTKSTSIKPEDEFGYKEPTYNDDGSLATDSSNNVIYKLSDNTGKYQSTDRDGNTLSYGDITYDGAYRRFMGQKFSCSKFEADGGQAYGTYSDGSYTATTAYTQSQNALTSTNGKRTWGLPSDKESSNFTIFSDDSDRVEHFNGRNQFSGDRLGSWGDCYYYGNTILDSYDDGAPYGELYGDSTSKPSGMNDTNTGRYLPIKLTVTNELMSSIVEKVIPNIFTSMGTLLQNSDCTYKYMHNYTFTEWTYVQNPDTNPVYPYSPNANTDEWGENTVGEAFQPQPTSTYFDMLTDLDKYADSEGVIRLFPLFSNGKKSSVSSSEKSNYTKGGGSSLKLKIIDSSNNVDYKYPFFNTDIYNNGTGSFTYDNNGTSTTVSELKSEYIRLFSYNNITISSSSTSSLEFSANNVKDKPTGWLTTTSDSTTSLQWTKLYTLDSNYIQNQLIKNYGEGMYTFYVFVANYSYQNGPTSTSTDSQITALKNTFDSFYNNIVSQASEGKFTSLQGKRLIQVTSIDSEYKENNDSEYRCSPTVVAFEKIDEPKLMVTSSTPSDVSSFISSNYSSGRSFYRNVNPLYEGVKDSSTGAYSITGDDLSSSSPYTYLVKNVDLSTTDSNNFVISFNSDTSSTDLFNTSNDDMEYEYLISNPGSEISEESVYVRPFGDNGYIQAISTTSSSGQTQITFKVNDDYLDVYDILIKYNTKNNKYDIYLRRHDKLFCYVFDQDLAGYTTDNFVNHDFDLTTFKTGCGATLLFDKNYSEGHTLKSSDKSSTVNSGFSLDECLRLKIGQDSTYSNDDLLEYRLIDRITGKVVAYYEKTTDENNNVIYTLNCSLDMEKNHILYLNHYSSTN
jgi:hypothetical protein